jgi:hypothetical protein
MSTSTEKPTPPEQDLDHAHEAFSNQGALFPDFTSPAANDDDGADAPEKGVIADVPAPDARPPGD